MRRCLAALPESLRRSGSSAWIIAKNSIQRAADLVLEEGLSDAASHGSDRHSIPSPSAPSTGSPSPSTLSSFGTAIQDILPPAWSGDAAAQTAGRVTHISAADQDLEVADGAFAGDDASAAAYLLGGDESDTAAPAVEPMTAGDGLSGTQPMAAAEGAAGVESAAAGGACKEPPAAVKIQCHQMDDTSEHGSTSEEDLTKSPAARALCDGDVSELMKAAKELCARFRKMQRDAGQPPTFEVKDVIDAVMWLDSHAREMGSLHAVLGLPEERSQAQKDAEMAEINAWIREAEADPRNGLWDTIQEGSTGTSDEEQGVNAGGVEGAMRGPGDAAAGPAGYYMEEAAEGVPRAEDREVEEAGSGPRDGTAQAEERPPAVSAITGEESVSVRIAPSDDGRALEGGEEFHPAVTVTLCVIAVPADMDGGQGVENAAEASSVEELTGTAVSNSVHRSEEEVVEDAMALPDEPDAPPQSSNAPRARRSYAEALGASTGTDAGEAHGREQHSAAEGPGAARTQRDAGAQDQASSDATNTATPAAWQMHPLSHALPHSPCSPAKTPKHAAWGAASAERPGQRPVGGGRVRRDDSAHEPAEILARLRKSLTRERAAKHAGGPAERVPAALRASNFTATRQQRTHAEGPARDEAPPLPAAVVRALRQPENFSRLVKLRELCNMPALLDKLECKLAEERKRLELELVEERRRIAAGQRLYFDLAELRRGVRNHRPAYRSQTTVSAATSPMVQRRRSRWVDCAVVTTIVFGLLGLLLTFLILSARQVRDSIAQREAALRQQTHNFSFDHAPHTRPALPPRDKDTYIRVAWDTSADIIKDVNGDLHEGAARLAPKLDHDLHAARDAAVQGGEHVLEGVRAGASKVASAPRAAQHAAVNAAEHVRDSAHAGASRVASTVDGTAHVAWDAAAGAAHNVKEGVDAGASKVTATIDGTAHAARDAAVGAVHNVQEGVHNVQVGVHAGAARVASTVDNTAQAAWNAAASVSKGVKEGVHAAASKVASTVDRAVKAAGHAASSAAENVKGAVHGGITKVASTVDHTAKAAGHAATSAAHNVQEGVHAGASKVASTVDHTAHAAQHAASSAAHTVKQGVHAGASHVASTVENTVHTAQHAAASAAENVKQGAHAGASKVASTVENTVHTAQHAAENVREGVHVRAAKVASTVENTVHTAQHAAANTAENIKQGAHAGAAKVASTVENTVHTAQHAAANVREGVHAGAAKVASTAEHTAQAARDTTTKTAATVRDRLHAGADRATRTWQAASSTAADIAEDIRVGLCPSAASNGASRAGRDCQAPSPDGSAATAQHEPSPSRELTSDDDTPAPDQQLSQDGGTERASELPGLHKHAQEQPDEAREMAMDASSGGRIGSVIQYDVHISEASVHPRSGGSADVHAVRTDLHMVQTDMMTGPANKTHKEAYSGTVVSPGLGAVAGEPAQGHSADAGGLPGVRGGDGVVRMRRGWPPYEWWGKSFSEIVTLQRAGLLVSAVALLLALRPE